MPVRVRSGFRGTPTLAHGFDDDSVFDPSKPLSPPLVPYVDHEQLLDELGRRFEVLTWRSTHTMEGR